jgi:hypothetical protein
VFCALVLTGIFSYVTRGLVTEVKKKYSGQAAANKFDEVCPAPAAGSTGGWADSFAEIMRPVM